MKCQTWAKFALGLAALLPLSVASLTHAQAVDELERSLEPTIGEPPADVAGADEDAYEVLTRGPIHEAFAEQVSINPTEGIVVPEAPPEAVNEIPPDAKPADAKSVWIDGYWAWDDIDKRYIWISGVWRVAPSGYSWTPGYWTETDGGWRWIGGFWTGADRVEVAYQPEPPASLEEGPTSEAPSENHIWVPGCWYYRNADYAWRPGYWTVGHDNWVWIPNYYRYTPRGYVLCGGYYDVPLATRGSLFAPVYFHRPIYTTANWYYTPRVAIGLGALNFHMFVRPNYCHYYFGDYYGSRYSGLGWYPWHTYSRHRGFYDPLFSFNVWRYNRRGINFYDRYDRWHKYYDRHEDHRPRHTFRDQNDWVAKNRDGDRDGWQHSTIGERFEDRVRENRDRFVNLDDSDRRRYREISDRTRNFRRERAESESVADGRDGRGDGDRPRGDGEGRGDRDRGSLRLPGAIGGGRDRGDEVRGDGEGRGPREGARDSDGEGRGDQSGRGGRDVTDRGGDSPRDVLRPDLDRDGVTTPRTGGNDSGRDGIGRDGDGRGPRGDNNLPRTETPRTPDATPTPETPSATPGDSPRTLPRDGRNDGSPRDRGDGLPTLPRNDRIDRTRVGDVDRSSLQPQPGTVRDSERPFNTERRSDTPRSGDIDRGSSGRGSFDRGGSATPRVETPPTLDRGGSTRSGLQRSGGSDPRRGTSNPLGGDRPSALPSTPRVQQPSPRIQQPTPTPRVETNRPSFDRGSSSPQVSPRSSGRSTVPSISPRSGIGGAGSAFTPRSSGSGRSSAPAIRSGGGGGGSAPAIRSGGSGRSGGPSIRSGGGGGGGGFGRSGIGGRSGGGGRGRD